MDTEGHQNATPICARIVLTFQNVFHHHIMHTYIIYTSQPECVNTILHCTAIWVYTSTFSWIIIQYIHIYIFRTYSIN